MKKHCLSLERMTAMPFQGNAKKPFLINDILKKSTTFCSYRYLSIINILIITIQKSHFSTPNYASSKKQRIKTKHNLPTDRAYNHKHRSMLCGDITQKQQHHFLNIDSYPIKFCRNR